jgi:hypothetical protein
MAQRSWPWSTVAGLGDGAAELSEAYSREFLALYFGVQNPAVEGVCKGVSIGELAVTGIATPLSVAAGAGICYGLYLNDAAATVAVSTPAIGTTGGRVVLQTNWAGTGGAGLEARTRLAVKMSADGVIAIPALTQAFGTTWEISLATFTVTTGGVITVTDDRTFRRATSVVNTDEIVNLAVTEAKIGALAVTAGKIGALAVESAKINNLAVTEAKIGGLAVTETKLGPLAVTEGKIGALAVTEGKIGALAVTNGKLGNDSVDDIKAGNRVPAFTRRQGGSATDWDDYGANNYTPTAVRMQGGCVLTSAGGDVTVTFPVAFSAVPLLLLTNASAASNDFSGPQLVSITASQFVCRCISDAGARLVAALNWLAIGPE